MSQPNVAIILVVWNNWRDTVDCLESLLRLDYKEKTIIVVDNNSQVDVEAKLIAWANGSIAPSVSQEHPLAHLVWPPAPKPVQLWVTHLGTNQMRCPEGEEPDVILLRSPQNKGFAAGNNLGMDFARRIGSPEYFWLLNNDTLVESDALQQGIDYMQRNPGVGLCGATLLEFMPPGIVQVRGGIAYDPRHARGEHIGAGDLDCTIDAKQVADIESAMQAVQGASMLANSQFVREVGPMPEEFFLYFEEMEWAFRAAGRFRFGYAQHSRVYHRQGGTVEYKRGSFAANYYFTRNRLRFTRKRYPEHRHQVLVHVALIALKRLLRGEFDTARIMFRAIAEA